MPKQWEVEYLHEVMQELATVVGEMVAEIQEIKKSLLQTQAQTRKARYGRFSS